MISLGPRRGLIEVGAGVCMSTLFVGIDRTFCSAGGIRMPGSEEGGVGRSYSCGGFLVKTKGSHGRTRKGLDSGRSGRRKGAGIRVVAEGGGGGQLWAFDEGE